MGIDIYDTKNKVTPDDIVADGAFQDLLRILFIDLLFLSRSQINAFLRHAKPAHTSVKRFDNRVGTLLGVLVDHEFLGHESVERLPPVTIGNRPLVILSREKSRVDVAVATAAAAASAGRIPPLDAHARARLYFGRDKLGPVLRRLGHALPSGTLVPPAYMLDGGSYPPLRQDDEWALIRRCEDQARLTGIAPEGVTHPDTNVRYRYVPWPGREAQFRTIYEWHRAVEKRPSRTPQELSGTHLTAHFNLNALRFPPPAALVNDCHGWVYQANGNFDPGYPDGSFGPAERGRNLRQYAVSFLRFCHAYQIRQQAEEFWGHKGCWESLLWM